MKLEAFNVDELDWLVNSVMKALGSKEDAVLGLFSVEDVRELGRKLITILRQAERAPAANLAIAGGKLKVETHAQDHLPSGSVELLSLSIHELHILRWATAAYAGALTADVEKQRSKLRKRPNPEDQECLEADEEALKGCSSLAQRMDQMHVRARKMTTMNLVVEG